MEGKRCYFLEINGYVHTYKDKLMWEETMRGAILLNAMPSLPFREGVALDIHVNTLLQFINS